MKIKRYRGKSLPEVMLRIKEELGEDAVILSTKRVGETFEVIAAVDLSIDDEPRRRIELIEEVRREPPQPHVSTPPEDPVGRVLVEIEDLKKALLAQAQRDRELKELKKELKTIKGILESGMVSASLSMDEEALSVCNRLREMEVDERLIGMVARSISQEELLSPWVLCRDMLEKLLITDKPRFVPGLPVVLVGPTGVGKTTTLAKLASILKLYEGRDVALLSIDTFRVGASEQLQVYADILGIDLFTANTPDEFGRFVSFLKDKVLLVDTAGRSYRDALRKEEIEDFLRAVEDYILLVAVTYGCRFKEALKIIESFSVKRPDGIVLTKLDETEVYGLPVNICWHTKLPITYITTGQRVPEDIEEASTKTMVDYILGEEAQ